MNKSIPWFPLYTIDESGYITNIKTGKIIKSFISKTWYVQVTLCYWDVWHRKTKTMLVHRLVMLTYVWYSPLTINHIDGNKLNNHLSNLEYCSLSDNIQHSFSTWLNETKKPKSVGAYIHSQLIYTFNSTYEAWKILWISQWNIYNVLVWRMKSYKGYNWKYI